MVTCSSDLFVTICNHRANEEVIMLTFLFQFLIPRKMICCAISKSAFILLMTQWPTIKRSWFIGKNGLRLSNFHMNYCYYFVICSYYGVSRSATIVVAYVMRKYHLSMTPAFERWLFWQMMITWLILKYNCNLNINILMTLYCRVKSKRRFVQPNNGFVVQLRLFHKMGWKIDANHEKYKLYRLRMAADKVRKGKLQCIATLNTWNV